MSPRLHHLAIAARDFDASHRFYTEGLGLKEVFRFGTDDAPAALYACESGQPMIEVFTQKGDEAQATAAEAWDQRLSAGPSRSGKSAIMHLAIGVDDVAAAVKQAVAAGATIDIDVRTAEPKGLAGHPDSKFTLAFLRGPSGESVELIEHRAFKA